ncbi:MAG: hypothetical protein ACXADO_03880 [Candidatus Thorarchaeota archaeon]
MKPLIGLQRVEATSSGDGISLVLAYDETEEDYSRKLDVTEMHSIVGA